MKSIKETSVELKINNIEIFTLTVMSAASGVDL